MAPRFYNQPLTHRFGRVLIELLESGEWAGVDISVAWVRRSGIAYLRSALKGFLGVPGNSLRVTVGIDIDNTSYEGLEDLLELESYGDAKVFVHHNEDPSVTFHPKLYLFTRPKRAKLIVASNNLTRSGLFRNTEAGFEIEADPGDRMIEEAKDAIEAWRDPSTGLSHRLDAGLLDALLTRGYVKRESALRQRSARVAPGFDKGESSDRPPLFSVVPVSAPTPPTESGSGEPPAGSAIAHVPRRRPRVIKKTGSEGEEGSVLIMRIRKASVTGRPTQTQMPKAVWQSAFFKGVSELTSTHDARKHGVHEAVARGAVNTLKLEIPEMRTLAEPVLRLERTSTGVSYEVHDALSPKGRLILTALKEGFKSRPPSTRMTSAPSKEQATWWRFV